MLRRLSPTSAAIKRASDGRPKDVLSRVGEIESRMGPGTPVDGYKSKKFCP